MIFSGWNDNSQKINTKKVKKVEKENLCEWWTKFCCFRVSTAFHVSIKCFNVHLGWRFVEYFRPSSRVSSSCSPKVRSAELEQSELLHEHRWPEFEGSTAVRWASCRTTGSCCPRASTTSWRRPCWLQDERQRPSRGRPAICCIADLSSSSLNRSLVNSTDKQLHEDQNCFLILDKQLLLLYLVKQFTNLSYNISESALK